MKRKPSENREKGGMSMGNDAKGLQMSVMEFEIVRQMLKHGGLISLDELHKLSIQSPRKSGRPLSKPSLSRIMGRLVSAGLVRKIGRKHGLTGIVREQCIIADILDRMNSSDFMAFGAESGQLDFVVEEGPRLFRVSTLPHDGYWDQSRDERPKIVLFGGIRGSLRLEDNLDELERRGFQMRDEGVRCALRDLREAVVCILADHNMRPTMKAYALYEAWELLSLRLEAMNASESDMNRIGMMDFINDLREDDGVRLVDDLRPPEESQVRSSQELSSSWPSTNERRILVMKIKAAAARAKKGGWVMPRSKRITKDIIEQLWLPLRQLDFPPLVAVLAPRGFSGEGTKWAS
jgi:hypothetical protein